MKHLRLPAAIITAAALFVGGFASVHAAPAPQGDDDLGVIEGSVFLDEDADGRFDPDERPLAGFEVRLEGADERTAVTLANGRYRFENLPAGDYTVLIERDDEQRETYVSSIRYENLKVEGTLLVGIDFGLQERDAVAADATQEAGDEMDGDIEDETGGDTVDEAAAEGVDEAAGDDADDDGEAAVQYGADAPADEGMDADAPSSAESAPGESTTADADVPAMTAANMMPALREMLESAASAGQTVDDLDPAARQALDDALAALSTEERSALERMIAEDEELAELARTTGADQLLGRTAYEGGTAPAMDQPAAEPATQVGDMPQAGAEELLGWPALAGLIALLALLGAAGMAAERRA